MNTWYLAFGLGYVLLSGAALAVLAVALRRTQQRQQRWWRQLDAAHAAQGAYAEATETALSHLRDGLQTLTTVSANHDMKLYALELRQRHRQRSEAQARSGAGAAAGALAGAAVASTADTAPQPGTVPPAAASMHQAPERVRLRPAEAQLAAALGRNPAAGETGGAAR